MAEYTHIAYIGGGMSVRVEDSGNIVLHHESAVQQPEGVPPFVWTVTNVGDFIDTLEGARVFAEIQHDISFGRNTT